MTPYDSRLPHLLAVFLLAAPILSAGPALAVKQPPVKTTATAPARAAASLIAQARAAQSKGDNDLAVRLAQAAIVADPAQTSGYNALGDVYAAAGEGDFARGYYDEALSIDPADPAALKAMAALDRAGSQRDARAETGGQHTGTP